jgi:TonB family protein
MRSSGPTDQRKLVNIVDYLSNLAGRRIVLAAFFLSVLIHVGALAVLQGIFPGTWFKPKLRTYKVDLIRPPMEEITKIKKEESPAVTQIHSEPPEEPSEATISLDTKDSTYIPYTKVLKQRIRSHWIYPLSAQENLIQGSLMIVFRLNSGGNLITCNVVRPSTHEILDKYAVEAIRSANPFPPFPENIKVEFLNINASFAYLLQFE